MAAPAEEQPPAAVALRRSVRAHNEPVLRKQKSEASLLQLHAKEEKLAVTSLFIREGGPTLLRLDAMLRESTPVGVPYFMAGLAAPEYKGLANTVACARPAAPTLSNPIIMKTGTDDDHCGAGACLGTATAPRGAPSSDGGRCMHFQAVAAPS